MLKTAYLSVRLSMLAGELATARELAVILSNEAGDCQTGVVARKRLESLAARIHAFATQTMAGVNDDSLLAAVWSLKANVLLELGHPGSALETLTVSSGYLIKALASDDKANMQYLEVRNLAIAARAYALTPGALGEVVRCLEAAHALWQAHKAAGNMLPPTAAENDDLEIIVASSALAYLLTGDLEEARQRMQEFSAEYPDRLNDERLRAWRLATISDEPALKAAALQWIGLLNALETPEVQPVAASPMTPSTPRPRSAP